MVEYQSSAHASADASGLDSTFQALSDSTRRAILEQLARGESSIGELAEPFEISLAAVSKHVRVLENAGLVERRVEGRSHYCRLNAGPLHDVASWSARYRQFWEERLEKSDARVARKPETRRRGKKR